MKRDNLNNFRLIWTGLFVKLKDWREGKMAPFQLDYFKSDDNKIWKEYIMGNYLCKLTKYFDYFIVMLIYDVIKMRQLKQ